jgi:hypothetical protein
MRRFCKSLCPVRSYAEQYPGLVTAMTRDLIVVVLCNTIKICLAYILSIFSDTSSILLTKLSVKS